MAGQDKWSPPLRFAGAETESGLQAFLHFFNQNATMTYNIQGFAGQSALGIFNILPYFDNRSGLIRTNPIYAGGVIPGIVFNGHKVYAI